MKEKYRELCNSHSDIPLFQQAWWLDAVAGESWGVVVVEKGGAVQAALPFIKKHRFGLTVLGQPKLTQYLGPVIIATGAKRSKQLAREKDLMESLIDQLPPYHVYRQNWGPQYQNWMPFYWRGFSQTTRYTYRIEDLSDLDAVWSGFQEKARGDIRKARKAGVEVTRNTELASFARLNEMVFERQDMKVPYSNGLLKRIHQAALERDQCAIFTATDSEGQDHAALYLVWDEHSAYYLMGGGDPRLRNSGATSLCIWEAIQYAASVTRSFDFEGSMIEPVERFIRGFGGEPTPYFSVQRSGNRLLRFALAVKG